MPLLCLVLSLGAVSTAGGSGRTGRGSLTLHHPPVDPRNDTLRGNQGVDTHAGGAGDDFIDARGDRPDVVSCGTGNDTVYGGDGNDVIDESQNRGNNPKAPIDETNTLDGGPGNDVILGSPGKDTIDGGTSTIEAYFARRVA